MIQFRCGILQIAFSSWMVLSACSISKAAIDSDEIDDIDGTYSANEAAPDELTTTKMGKTLKVTRGRAFPLNIFDQGQVRLTAMEGPKAIFSGRSIGWGCTYEVEGIYTSEEGEEGDAGGLNIWDNTFKDAGAPRIVLELNGPGAGDNVVLSRSHGGTLWIYAVTDPVDSSVTVNLSRNPEDKLSEFLATKVVPGWTWTSVPLKGAAAGDFTINATATVPGYPELTASVSGTVFGFHGTLEPDVFFEGRSSSKLGITETGKLGVEVYEPEESAEYEPFTWSQTSGGGVLTITSMSDGTGTIKAGETYQEVELTLKDKDDNSIQYNFTIVQPDRIRVENKWGDIKWHIENSASVGYLGTMYVYPSDVSFGSIEFTEMGGKITVTGSMDLPDFRVLEHPFTGWQTIISRDVTAGHKLTNDDHIGTGVVNEKAIGSYDYPAHWWYRIRGNVYKLAIIEQRANITADGAATVIKGGGKFGHEETAAWDEEYSALPGFPVPMD